MLRRLAIVLSSALLVLPARLAAAADATGLVLVDRNGGTAIAGDATDAGEANGVLTPVVGAAATPTGEGDWMTTVDGVVLRYGDAPYKGSAASQPLNQPIVGMAAHPSGRGYWLLAADGGVFPFGIDRFHGSAGANPPPGGAVAVVATPSGNGYWIVSGEGRVLPFGDAAALTSPGRQPSPVVAAA